MNGYVQVTPFLIIPQIWDITGVPSFNTITEVCAMTNANSTHDIYLTGSSITCISNKLGTTHWFRVINEAYAQLLQQQQQLQQQQIGMDIGDYESDSDRWD